MNVHGINGLPPVRGNGSPINRRIKIPKKRETDQVYISAGARKNQSISVLIDTVKRYLEKLPDVRKDRVDAVTKKIKKGYRLDNKMVSVVAERLLSR